jgi:hypothetical protein
MVEKTMMGKTYNIHWDTSAGGKAVANGNQEEMKSAPTGSGASNFPSDFKIPQNKNAIVPNARSYKGG